MGQDVALNQQRMPLQWRGQSSLEKRYCKKHAAIVNDRPITLSGTQNPKRPNL